ncbi:MAG TPA: serine hydrolase domain-containing protein [Gammaproteobacteria bacterium]
MSAIPRLEAVDEVLERAAAEHLVPGAVAIVTDRRGVLHEAAFGLASTREQRPMRTDTVFRIASMTKPLTAVAVLMLAEEGKLALDDPLARHLPGYAQPQVLEWFDAESGKYTVRPAKRDVTIRDLLTHTSGYGYWFLDREILIEAQGRIEYFNPPFLMHDPGERFSYGIGTDVLGQIIEPLSGMPLARFFAERITAPLGMTETGFDVPEDRARLAGVHDCRDDRFDDAPAEARSEAPRGGGGLYSTARDYAAFVRLLLNGGVTDRGERLLGAESVAAMTRNQIGDLRVVTPRSVFPPRTLDFSFLDGTQQFGFNLAIETRARPGRRAPGSWGWAGIFNTYFWGDPTAGIGVVLMMQLRPFCEPRCLRVLDDLEKAIYAA